MKNSKLQLICGLKIIDAVFSIGDAGISFENGIGLAIYNNFVLVGLSQIDEKSLIGKCVTDIDEDIAVITIKVGANMAIKIDMRDEAYTGPEAIQLRIPNEPIIVW
jgi:hypothetical protein